MGQPGGTRSRVRTRGDARLVGVIAALLWAAGCALECAPEAGDSSTAQLRSAVLESEAEAGTEPLELAEAEPPLEADEECAGFALAVEALFTSYCAGCHGNGKAEGGFDAVLQHDELIASRRIVPAEPAASRVYVFVESGVMPRTERKPSADEIAVLRSWIECGAPAW